jgi:hypothetical protein
MIKEAFPIFAKTSHPKDLAMFLAHFGGTARQQNRIRLPKRRREGGGGGRRSIPIILGGRLDGISPSSKPALQEEGCAVHHPFLSFSCFAIESLSVSSDSLGAMDFSSSSLLGGAGGANAAPVTITTHTTRPDVVRFFQLPTPCGMSSPLSSS